MEEVYGARLHDQGVFYSERSTRGKFSYPSVRNRLESQGVGELCIGIDPIYPL